MRYVCLLVVRVSGKLDDLTPVQEWRRDRLERIRGADEKGLTKVDGNVDVVILSRS